MFRDYLHFLFPSFLLFQSYFYLINFLIFFPSAPNKIAKTGISLLLFLLLYIQFFLPSPSFFLLSPSFHSSSDLSLPFSHITPFFFPSICSFILPFIKIHIIISWCKFDTSQKNKKMRKTQFFLKLQKITTIINHSHIIMVQLRSEYFQSNSITIYQNEMNRTVTSDEI